MTKTLAKKISSWLSGAERVAVMGVGNVLRGDDGVGSEIAKGLARFNSEKFLAVDCGDAPEVFVYDVVNFSPSHVIVVDAADFDEEPGTVKLFFPNEIENLSGFISTHELALTIAVGMLRLEGIFELAMLGVQVGNTALGSEMSSKVKKSIEVVVEKISEVLRSVGILGT